ncbi:MAG TPA: alkaline phosphatase family protein [Ktedonobacteraceae bacterium]|nr:alkaline phosphatase family protein [Ktedonobacteraceae bacterium]
MVRVVVIGIDGLDADLLRVYGPSLPNLRLLMLESPYLELQSCFPPDHAPSWASIYTGRNPAQHGILSISSIPSIFSIQSNPEQAGSSTSCIPEGETFWERASQAGKRVCIVNPLFPYFASTLNGVMHAFPSWDSQEVGAGKKRSFARFCQSLHTITEQQTAIGLELLQREPWDVFFIQFPALDAVQHLFWRYSDPGDPAYPGKNEHSGRIRDCYALFDRVIGRFRAAMGDDCVLLIVSGYGHGRGHLHYLNLNEWLRAEGLLVTQPRHARLTRLFYAHALNARARQRSLALLTLQHAHPTYLSGSFADEYIISQQYIARHIDQQATLAQVAMMPHSPTFGGISLNQAAIQARRSTGNYEQVRNSIVQRLLHMRLHGRPVVHRAKVREEMYSGEYIDRFPDILFELRNEYGVSAAVHVPLTTNNLLHSIVSGAHQMQGVLLLGNLPTGIHICETGNEPTVMDVAPTIISLLGIPVTDANKNGQHNGWPLVKLTNTVALLRGPL